MAESGKINIHVSEEPDIFYIRIFLAAGGNNAEVTIRTDHTNVTCIKKNGATVLEKPIVPAEEEAKSLWRIEDVLDAARNMPLDNVKHLLQRQIDFNMAISKEGLTNDYGASIGKILLRRDPDSLRIRARASAAAGSDARMNGCELPVVITSGSGNQGITATMPVVAAARWLDIDEEKMLRAVTLSNLIAIRIKAKFGRLSNLCGATVAATGAACGIAYLLGGGYHEVCCTIQNMVGNVTGMVCDGAKADCALKISTCVNAACQAAAMGVRGVRVQSTDGIVEHNVEYTLDNFATLSTHGTSDSVILDLMLNKHLPETE